MHSCLLSWNCPWKSRHFPLNAISVEEATFETAACQTANNLKYLNLQSSFSYITNKRQLTTLNLLIIYLHIVTEYSLNKSEIVADLLLIFYDTIWTWIRLKKLNVITWSSILIYLKKKMLQCWLSKNVRYKCLKWHVMTNFIHAMFTLNIPMRMIYLNY